MSIRAILQGNYETMFDSPLQVFCLIFTTSLLTAVSTQTTPVYHYSLIRETSTTHDLSCPVDWELYSGGDGRCFKAMTDMKTTWDGARQSCISLGGDLAIILDKGTYSFVKDLVSELELEGNQAWLGLRKLSNEKASWINEEESAWPSDRLREIFEWNSVPSTKEWCIAFNSIKVKVECLNCSRNVLYICEKGPSSIIPILAESLNCPNDNWHLYSSNTQQPTCIRKTEDSQNWESTRKICSEWGGDLALIADESMEDFIKVNVIGTQKCWIGYSKKTNGRDTLELEGEEYNNWHPIDGQGSRKLCVYMESNNKWKWAACSDDNKGLCQLQPVPVTFYDYGDFTGNLINGQQKTVSKVNLTCPMNWTLYEKGMFCVGFFGDESDDEVPTGANIDTATTHCAQHGGHLAKITDAGVSRFIAAHRDPNVDYWFGLRVQEQNDVGVWHDGTYVNYTLWENSESIGPGCGILDNATNMWRIEDCRENHAFICQIDNVTEAEYLKGWTIDGYQIYISMEKTSYSSVPQKCESFNKVELSFESDDEFRQLTAWLNRNSHAFGEDIWIKTSKSDSDDYHWAIDANPIGEKGIWAHYDDIILDRNCSVSSHNNCCTIVTNTTLPDIDGSFWLSEKRCALEALYICVDRDEPPPETTITIPATQVSDTPYTVPPQIVLPSYPAEKITSATSLPSTSPNKEIPPTQTTSATTLKSFLSSISTQTTSASGVSTSVATTSPQTSLPSTSPTETIQPTTTPLPPQPPSKPLTPDEKEKFRESLNMLRAELASKPEPNTNTTKTAVVVNKLCPCACSVFKFSGFPSPSVLANMVNKIQKSLRVEITSLSSAKSKKTSAKDDRQSSESIAVFAVLFASIPFTMIIGVDLLRLYQFIQKRNMKKKPKNSQVCVENEDLSDSITIVSEVAGEGDEEGDEEGGEGEGKSPDLESDSDSSCCSTAI